MVKIVPVLESVIDKINDSKCKKTFNRFKSDRYKRLSKSWRKPRGIDNKVRRKFKGVTKMPSKGYKTENVIKHLTPEGYRKVMISNIKELEPLKSLNTFYCAEIRHAIGAKKRMEIIAKADEFGIIVLNRAGKLVEEAK